MKRLLKLTVEISCSDDKFAISESDGSTSELTLSVNIHSRTLYAVVFHTNNGIEPDCSNTVAIDERIE